MSNFTGVTFAQQKVLPSDDAIIRRASLSDGVLYGCEMSYSGSTLTMGSGQLLICGRQIRHPSAENWAIVDATSGFARLVLTVDLTKTSSKDSFEQVVDSIEYATSQDGFPELVREDVNVSGTRYQVVACVVSLGTGGITGIVNQLGPVEGGGGGLNFKVVPGMTQPGTATENTIWVKTDRINNYYFSATQPENMVEYDVWFPIGTSSTVAFSATKKNPVMVYPLSAKQYIGGNLVRVEAKSYQGGVWNDWISGEEWLFDYGKQRYRWQTRAWKYASGGAGREPTVTKNNDGSVSLTLAPSSGEYLGGAYELAEDVDLTHCNYLELHGEYSTTFPTRGGGNVYLLAINRGSSAWGNAAAAQAYAYIDTEFPITLNVASLSGKYDIALAMYSGGDAGSHTFKFNQLEMIE